VVDAATLLGCEGEETHGFHPCNRREGVVEVNSLLLDETMRHQTRLVLDHLSGLVLLELEDPLERDDMVAGWKIGQLPRLVPLNGVHLHLHRSTPCCVPFRLGEGTRLTVVLCKVQLNVKVVLRQSRDRLLAEEVVHGTVAQRLAAVVGVYAILVVGQWSGELYCVLLVVGRSCRCRA
jgi:hypothetical protein